MIDIDVRRRLIEQHDLVREHLLTCVRLARELVAGEPVAGRFGEALDDLRTALATHNQMEERLLEPRLTGELGALRSRRMFEEHADEHAVLAARLAGDEWQVAERMADVAEELAAHMDAEERTFLSVAALRPDRA